MEVRESFSGKLQVSFSVVFFYIFLFGTFRIKCRSLLELDYFKTTFDLVLFLVAIGHIMPN